MRHIKAHLHGGDHLSLLVLDGGGLHKPVGLDAILGHCLFFAHMGLSVFKGLDDRAVRAFFGTALVSLEAVISRFGRKYLFELTVVFQELQITILDSDVAGGLLKEESGIRSGACLFLPVYSCSALSMESITSSFF